MVFISIDLNWSKGPLMKKNNVYVTLLLLSMISALKADSCASASFCSIDKPHENKPSIEPVVSIITKNNDDESSCAKAPADEGDIPLTEDLMREHGILNRVLLMYEEVIRRIDTGKPFSLDTLSQAVNIIKTFIEEYHEKMEEDYLFPLFEKHRKEVKLVRTLKLQHTRGKEITNKVRTILTGKTELDQRQKRTIRTLLQQFITMYRPHEARENTVLFPLVRSLMSDEEFKEMGEKFDKLEHQLFGEHGFESIVGKVETLEKELGIYNLEQFTPESPVANNNSNNN